MAGKFNYRRATRPDEENAFSILQWSLKESWQFVGCTWFTGHADGRHGGGLGFKERPFSGLADLIRERIQVQCEKCAGYVLAMGAHETSTASNDSCQFIDLIQLDCDGSGPTMTDMANIIRRIGCRAILYPSPSDASEASVAKRFRVLLQCERYIPDPTDRGYERVWADRFHAVRVCFEGLLLATLDSATDRLSQLAYVHPVHLKRSPDDVIFIDGKIIDAQAVAEELRNRAIWQNAEVLGEPEDKTLEIESTLHLLDVLYRNNYLLGPCDHRGWVPTKCPREHWHSSGRGVIGSTAVNQETGTWLCQHAHSLSPKGPVRGATYTMIHWLSLDHPKEYAIGGLEQSFAVRRVMARLRANAAAMSSPLPLARVQADVIKLTDEVCDDYISGDTGILGIHAGTVGGGKSHAVPEIVKIAKHKTQCVRDEAKSSPSAAVSVRDRKAMKEAYFRLKEAGLRVIQQQSIDSVKDTDGAHICIYADRANQLTAEGLDARGVLCKGGEVGEPCPNSKVHGSAKDLCPAELGFVGDKDTDVVLCTHAGTPGLQKFLNEGTIFIQDEHESGALHHFTLTEVTLSLAQRRAKHLKDTTRGKALIAICEGLRKSTCLLGTEQGERDVLCFEFLQEYLKERGKDAFELWKQWAKENSEAMILWKQAVKTNRSAYATAIRRWERTGSRGAPPTYPVDPPAPTVTLTQDDVLRAAVRLAATGGRGSLDAYAEGRWRSTGELPGGYGAGPSLEALGRWIGGARSVKTFDREGKEIDGAWSIQWYGHSTSMIQKHILDRKGPGIVLDATADEQWWIGASSADRVKFRKVIIEDQAIVKRIVAATYQVRLRHIVNDDGTVRWKGLENAVVVMCRELYKYCPQGDVKVAGIARTQLALALEAFWHNVTASEMVNDPYMRTIATEEKLKIVAESMKGMTKTIYGNLSMLRARFPNVRWTWYGSAISVGSNELADAMIYLSLGDPLPPPEVAEANATVSKRSVVESASWIACSLVEQWYGRARAVRRKDVPLLMFHIGACVPQSWCDAAVAGLPLGKPVIVNPLAADAPPEEYKKLDIPPEYLPKRNHHKNPNVQRTIKCRTPGAPKGNGVYDGQRLCQAVMQEIGTAPACAELFKTYYPEKEYVPANFSNWANGVQKLSEKLFVPMACMYFDVMNKPSRWAILGSRIGALTFGRSFRFVASAMKKLVNFRGMDASWIDHDILQRSTGGVGMTEEQWKIIAMIIDEFEKLHPGTVSSRTTADKRSARIALEQQPMELLVEVAKHAYGIEIASAYGTFKTLNDEFFNGEMPIPWLEIGDDCCKGFTIQDASVQSVGLAMAHVYAREEEDLKDPHGSKRWGEILTKMQLA